jgi:hypothetical protein
MTTLAARDDSPKHFLARVRRWCDWRALRRETLALRNEAAETLGRIHEALDAEKAA